MQQQRMVKIEWDSWKEFLFEIPCLEEIISDTGESPSIISSSSSIIVNGLGPILWLSFSLPTFVDTLSLLLFLWLPALAPFLLIVAKISKLNTASFCRRHHHVHVSPLKDETLAAKWHSRSLVDIFFKRCTITATPCSIRLIDDVFLRIDYMTRD